MAVQDRPGVRVTENNPAFPKPVQSAEPELREVYLPKLVCERLSDMLTRTFTFNRTPERTNWLRSHDPRPVENYSYHANLYRQLIHATDDWHRLRLSWIQVMDLIFALRECEAQGWADPGDDTPQYEDHHLKVADEVLSRLQYEFDHKP